MQRQLILDFHHRYQSRLSDFVGARAGYVVSQIERVISGKEWFAYLCGGGGSGKTHLLESACHEAWVRGQRAMYIDLRNHHHYTPDMLAGLEGMQLICLDNIEAIAGYDAWEEGIFHLFNRLQTAAIPLLVAANERPAQLPLCLLDLRTRLSLGIVCQVDVVSDQERAQIIMQRAARFGVRFPEACLQYILHHHDRSMRAVLQLIDRIAVMAFEQKKSITLSLVKAAINTHY